jgi:hypothetical protein
MAGGGYRMTDDELAAFEVRAQGWKRKKSEISEVGTASIEQNVTPKKGDADNDAGELVEDSEHEGLERDLQLRCENYCDKHGFLCLHDRSKKKNEAGLFLDLIVALPAARVIWCELKRKGEKLSTEQKRTKARLLYLGHRVYEIRSFRQFVRACEENIIKKDEQ